MDTIFTLTKDILEATPGTEEVNPGQETLHTLWRKIVHNQGGSATPAPQDTIAILWKKYLINLGGTPHPYDNAFNFLWKAARQQNRDLAGSETLFTLLKKIASLLPETQDWVQRADSFGALVENQTRIDSAIRALKRNGLYDSLGFLVGPDGLVVSGPNRVSRWIEITDGNDATQGTAAEQPELSRSDNRMNLVTHSRLPGTLGATSPDGWVTWGIHDPPHGELVASDDAADEHQAWEVPALTGQRRYLLSDVAAVEGQKFLVAVRVEQNSYVSGDNGIFVWDGTQTVLGNRGFDVTANGEWAWLAGRRDATGTYQLRCGLGPGGNVTTDGPTRFSRSCILYLPDGWLSWTEAQRQTYLTDHYAASGTDHQEFPGYRGMRTVTGYGLAGKNIETSYDPHLDGGVTFFTILNSQSKSRNSFTLFASSGLQHSLALRSDGNIRYNHNTDTDATRNITTTDWEINKWFSIIGVSSIGERNKLYVDGVEKGEAASVQDSYTATQPLRIFISYCAVAWAGVIEKRLTPAEVSTLNAILKGES